MQEYEIMIRGGGTRAGIIKSLQGFIDFMHTRSEADFPVKHMEDDTLEVNIMELDEPGNDWNSDEGISISLDGRDQISYADRGLEYVLLLVGGETYLAKVWNDYGDEGDQERQYVIINDTITYLDAMAKVEMNRCEWEAAVRDAQNAGDEDGVEPCTNFKYWVDLDERGLYAATLYDDCENVVYRVHDAEQMRQLIEDGFMKHTKDMRGLAEHLASHNMIPKEATITHHG